MAEQPADDLTIPLPTWLGRRMGLGNVPVTFRFTPGNKELEAGRWIWAWHEEHQHACEGTASSFFGALKQAFKSRRAWIKAAAHG